MAERTIDSANRGDGELLFIDWAEVLVAIKRWLWWLVGAAVVLAVAAGLYAFNQPKVYRATSALVINPALPKVLGNKFDAEELAERASADIMFYNTQYDVMRSRSVFREAIERAGLIKNAEFLRAYNIPAEEATVKNVEAVVHELVDIAPEPKNRIVRLVVTDTDPERAALIADAVAQAYLDQTLESRVTTTRNASRWLDQRVEEFAQGMERLENELVAFKQESMLTAVTLEGLEQQRDGVSRGLATTNEKLLEVKTALIRLEAERNVIRGLTELDDMIAIPRVSRNETVIKYKEALGELSRKRAELGVRYGEKMPPMKEVDDQIEAVRNELKREVQFSVAALDNEIRELQQTARGLENEKQQFHASAMGLEKASDTYRKLSRELERQRKNHDELVQRRIESGLSARLESNFAEWLEHAEPMYRPVGPSIVLHAMIGGLVGILGGLLFTLISVLLDHNVHSESEIESILKIPALGILPSIPSAELLQKSGDVDKSSSGNPDLFVFENPKSSVAECARSIRTSLLFLGADKPLHTLLLTSAGPSEGKSTMAIALASSMAIAGNRVLLVDTDLRRPRLHKSFGVSGETGITNALLQASELDKAIHATVVRGLDLLPCGPLPPNPSELLHTDRFRELLAEMAKRYDRVIFDSPPVNAVTDAAILSQVVDGTILVIKASQTTKEAARRAARQLTDLKANVLGAVLNDVDLERNSYYGNKHYYYYRASYTYGNSPQKAG